MKKQKLIYPSIYAVRAFSNAINESNEYLEAKANKNNIHAEIMQTLLSKYSFDFVKCPTHQNLAINYFLLVSVTLCVYNWCNIN